VLDWRVNNLISEDEFTEIANEYRMKWRRGEGRSPKRKAEAQKSPPKSKWAVLRDSVGSSPPTAPPKILSLAAVREVLSATRVRSPTTSPHQARR
jgi:hypothetical protein